MDMMPHNVVIVQPGAREAIGKMADQMSPTPDSRGRTFVPDDNRILAATRMAEPGEKVTLKMNAPETPGDYEYVCTFPEHWMKMFGTLVVVKNLDEYLQGQGER
jgi:azurin